MRYKAKVLARFPEARLEVRTRWQNGDARHYSVMSGMQRIDIYNDHDTQGTTAAWRSALAWCYRNPPSSAA